MESLSDQEVEHMLTYLEGKQVLGLCCCSKNHQRRINQLGDHLWKLLIQSEFCLSLSDLKLFLSPKYSWKQTFGSLFNMQQGRFRLVWRNTLEPDGYASDDEEFLPSCDSSSSSECSEDDSEIESEDNTAERADEIDEILAIMEKEKPQETLSFNELPHLFFDLTFPFRRWAEISYELKLRVSKFLYFDPSVQQPWNIENQRSCPIYCNGAGLITYTVYEPDMNKYVIRDLCNEDKVVAQVALPLHCQDFKFGGKDVIAGPDVSYAKLVCCHSFAGQDYKHIELEVDVNDRSRFGMHVITVQACRLDPSVSFIIVVLEPNYLLVFKLDTTNNELTEYGRAACLIEWVHFMNEEESTNPKSLPTDATVLGSFLLLCSRKATACCDLKTGQLLWIFRNNEMIPAHRDASYDLQFRSCVPVDVDASFICIFSRRNSVGVVFDDLLEIQQECASSEDSKLAETFRHLWFQPFPSSAVPPATLRQPCPALTPHQLPSALSLFYFSSEVDALKNCLPGRWRPQHITRRVGRAAHPHSKLLQSKF